MLLEDGKRIDAFAALEMGLVGEVTEPGQVLNRARQLARHFVESNTVRSLVREGLVDHLTRVNQQESEALAVALCSPTMLKSLVERAVKKGDIKQSWMGWLMMMEGVMRQCFARVRHGGYVIEAAEHGLRCGDHLKSERPDIQWRGKRVEPFPLQVSSTRGGLLPSHDW